MPRTIEQFAADVVASGVLARDELTQFQAAQSATGESIADAQALARLLVRHGKLTKYQAAALYQGKTKGLVLGNYVLLDKLGAGGMGQVFKALHRRMDRVVALKVLPAEATKSLDNVKRFHREVKAAARLEHPNIVAAHDADEADGTHFLVMQYVEGKDLSAIVKASGPLPVPQAVECIRQAAQGLAYAHKRGVIHRDIKPANLLLDSEGTVKILDMGLARLEGQLHDAASVAGLTQSGQVMGTVDYMSPEQAEETRGVDARADQYSLGCTLWVLLTGRPMYGGTTTVAKLIAHRMQPAPSLRAARADVPEALDAVYHKMVAKEPGERYASMDDVLAALATCLGEAAPVTLDGPSSSDSKLTEFFRQIGGTKTAAPPVSVTAIDSETQQFQPEKIDTGTELRIQRAGRGASGEPKTSIPSLVKSAALPASPAPRALPGPARRLHPLVLFGGITVLGIGSIGGLLALLLWLVLPGGEPGPGSIPIVTVAVGDGVNYALDFDGQRSYVEIPTLQLPGGPLTVEAWITPRETEREAIFHCGGESFVSLHTFQDTLGFWREAPSYLKSVNNRRLQPGERIHVAGVWDGNQLRAFVNGRGSGPGKQIPPELAVNKMLVRAMIGGELRSGKLSGMFDGQIDELRVSTIARYNRDFTPLPPDTRFTSDEHTLALYHFDEGTGDELHDATGKHHGKIVGAKWERAELGAATGDYALDFAGEGRVELPPLPLAGSGDLCIEGWVTPRRLNPQKSVCVFNADHQMGLAIAPHGRWHVIVANRKSASAWFQSSPELAVFGRRMHVAGTLRPDGTRLYLDGKLVAHKPITNFRLGSEVTPQLIGIDWDGTIDQLRISKVARYAQDFAPPEQFQSDADTLALYHFDEGQGDVLRDSSAKGHHGKIVGAKWVRLDEAKASSEPLVDFALSFDGETSVDLPETIKLDSAEDFTLEAYATPRQIARYGAVVGSKLRTEIILNSTQDQPRWSFAAEASQGHSGVASTSQQFALDRRTHLAAVRRGQRYSLFVDGKLAASREMDLPLRAIDQPWRIGKAFIGEIDEVRLSQVARYESEFTPEPRFANDEHTLALYHFDEGTGEVLRDSSGNQRHGRIVGAKWVKVEPLSAAGVASALEFTADARVELPALPLAGLSEACVEAWVIPQIVTPGAVAVIFNADNQASIKINAKGYWDVVFSNGKGEWHPLGSPQPKVNGRLTHVAGVLGSGRVQLYVDGKRVAYKPALNFRLSDVNKPAIIGENWEGTIEQLRLSKVGRYDEDFTPLGRLASDTNTIALYHFDEGAGAVLRDSSKDNHHGKIVGAKWILASGGRKSPDSAPPDDYALKFAGQSLVDIPSLERNAAEPLTIEAWVKDVADHTGVLACIRGKYPAQMHIANGHFLSGGERLPEAKLWRGFSTQERIDFSSWNHVAYVIDERGATLFVDGKKAGEFPQADYAPPWTVAYRAGASIGGDGEPGKPAWTLWGSIRELRFSNSVRYDRDFTPEPRFSADAAALALYHFDEGTGEVLRDATGKHDGKIVGAKWVKVDAPPPPPDYALKFDGKSLVEIPSLERNIAQPLTIEAWVKDVPDHTGILACVRGKCPAQMHIAHNPAAGQFLLGGERRAEGKLWREVGTRQSISFAFWTHCAYVIDERGATLFVDGKQAGEFPQADYAPRWTAPYRAGAAIGGDAGKLGEHAFTLQGSVRELRFSNSARYDRDFTPQQRFEPDAATLALYHFDEGAGDVLRDSSRNGHDGKIVGAKWVRAEFVESTGALDFSGDAQVLLPPLPIAEDSELCVEAWVTPRPLKLGNHPHVFNSDNQMGLKIEHNGHWNVVANNGYQDSPQPAEAGRRVHLAGTLRPGEIRLYIDGKLVAKKSATKLRLGRQSNPPILGAQWDGTIDELRVSKIVRYDKDFVPSDPLAADGDTLALYHFDEGTGDELRDSSGNNRHGKIVGAKWVPASGGGESPESAPPAANAPLDATEAKARQRAWAEHLGRPVEQANSVGMKLIVIPPGKFLMGRMPGESAKFPENKLYEEPAATQHPVTLTRPFVMGATEVTQRQWRDVVGSEPWKGQTRGEVGDDYPATYTTKAAAEEFCRRLSEKEGLKYRLPTEAEWEFACRAGTDTLYFFGESGTDVKKYACQGGLQPVATKRPNTWGLFDMLGNLWEWVADGTAAHPTEAVVDPLVTPKGLSIVRGSCFRSAILGEFSSGARHSWPGTLASDEKGFRVVCELDARSVTARGVIAPAEGMVNLLPLIDIERDKVVGDWEQDASGFHLRTKQGNQIEQFSRLALPVVPAAGSSYRVQVKFTALQDGRGMGLILPIGDRQVMAGVAIVGGLGLVDGKQIGMQGNPTLCNPPIKAGTQYTLDVWVRPDGEDVDVEAHFDGSALFRWQGEISSLALHDDWKMPRSDVLGLCEWSLVPFTVHHLKLEMLSGEAKVAAASGRE